MTYPSEICSLQFNAILHVKHTESLFPKFSEWRIRADTDIARTLREESRRPGTSRSDQSADRDRARWTGGSENGRYWSGGRFTRQEQNASTHCEACRGWRGTRREKRGAQRETRISGYRDRCLQLAQNFSRFLSSLGKDLPQSEVGLTAISPLNCVWSCDIMGRTSSSLSVAW